MNIKTGGRPEEILARMKKIEKYKKALKDMETIAKKQQIKNKDLNLDSPIYDLD
jgi:hypothetical protein